MFKIISFVFWLFVILFLYRVFSRFIMPVFRMTRMAGDQMRKMQQQLNEMDRRSQEQSDRHKPSKRKDGDYIDYEEVK